MKKITTLDPATLSTIAGGERKVYSKFQRGTMTADACKFSAEQLANSNGEFLQVLPTQRDGTIRAKMVNPDDGPGSAGFMQWSPNGDCQIGLK